MKRKTVIPILLLLACLPDLIGEKPTGLMVEFIRDPSFVRVNDLNPEFSWIVPASASFQTAYQILIASSAEKLARNTGDVYDSRKVMSSRSTEVEMGGNPLSTGTRYFWKVRIWDKKDLASEYSAAQLFKTGDGERYATTRNRFLMVLNKPETLVKTSGNSYFADFGKDAFGTLVLELDAAKNENITIHLGEKKSGNNRVDRNPGGSIRYQKVVLPVSAGKATYTVKLKKDERNTGNSAVILPDSVGIITPFRYCEIEDCNSELKPENILQKAYWYYFDDNESSFSGSDTVLNRVWDICKYSMKATSFAGYYIDGDRERIPYEADAYINQLGHYCTDREYSLARLTNEYFIRHPTWPTEWILHTVPMFYNDLMYTDNIESAKEYYVQLKNKTLLSLAREDGLISAANCTDEIMTAIGFANPKERLRDIVDWPPAQKDTGWKLAGPEGERDGYDMVPVNTVVNAFYYRNLVMMSELAGYLDNTEDSIFFREKATRVRQAFNEKLLSRKTGIYVDGESSEHSSLHANMTALAFGLVPEENVKAVTGFIKSRGMACSVYGAQYLLEGLYRAGESDYALKLLTDTGDRSWWNMIRSGSTITMEAWDMKYKPNSDWNHAWGAVPANIIPGFMWGIAPEKPGFAAAVIKPQLSTLKYCRIKVPTIRGTIEAEYKRKNDTGEYLLVIPGNISCTFVTDRNQSIVSLNGKKTGTGKSEIELQPGKNLVITGIN